MSKSIKLESRFWIIDIINFQLYNFQVRILTFNCVILRVSNLEISLFDQFHMTKISRPFFQTCWSQAISNWIIELLRSLTFHFLIFTNQISNYPVPMNFTQHRPHEKLLVIFPREGRLWNFGGTHKILVRRPSNPGPDGMPVTTAVKDNYFIAKSTT